jgi:DNA repair exonuclease SbcCD ATPase subunit
MLNKKLALVASGICPECKRGYEASYLAESKLKLEETKLKLAEYTKKIFAGKKELREKLSKIDEKIGYFNTRLSRANSLLSRIQTRKNQKAPVVDKARMVSLEKMLVVLDPKGFPSYFFQAYIPSITQTTNQLLSVIFPDTKVNIRTEKPESNRPDFTPYITRGSETLELSDLCGSERVLVNLCFRLGVLVLFKRLCNTSIDFMLIDEGFEKLDDANSIKVIELLNSFFAMGYLSQVILVTHKDVLKNMEDINYISI